MYSLKRIRFACVKTNLGCKSKHWKSRKSHWYPDALAPSLPFLLNLYYVLHCCVCSFTSAPVLCLYSFQCLRACKKFADYCFKWKQSSPFFRPTEQLVFGVADTFVLVVQKWGLLSFTPWDVWVTILAVTHCQVGNYKYLFFFSSPLLYIFFPLPQLLFQGSFYVIKTESASLSSVFMLTIMLVLKFKTIFLRRIFKGALLPHSVLPNTIGSAILIVQTFYSKTILLSVHHCVRLLFLS